MLAIPLVCILLLHNLRFLNLLILAKKLCSKEFITLTSLLLACSWLCWDEFGLIIWRSLQTFRWAQIKWNLLFGWSEVIFLQLSDSVEVLPATFSSVRHCPSFSRYVYLLLLAFSYIDALLSLRGCNWWWRVGNWLILNLCDIWVLWERLYESLSLHLPHHQVVARCLVIVLVSVKAANRMVPIKNPYLFLLLLHLFMENLKGLKHSCIMDHPWVANDYALVEAHRFWQLKPWVLS